MPHAVELTVIDMRCPPVSLARLASSLSVDERSRAGRFRTDLLRSRFQIARGMLRQVLAKSCKVEPAALTFAYSDYGKPSLPDFPQVQFNASHSGNFWVCATSADGPVGIDIEQARPARDLHMIALRFFSPQEQQKLAAFPESEKEAAFFRCWTRKEAYIKALGEGLSRGLSTFSVSCSIEPMSTVHDSLSVARYSIRSFEPACGYNGALATPAVAQVQWNHP